MHPLIFLFNDCIFYHIDLPQFRGWALISFGHFDYLHFPSAVINMAPYKSLQRRYCFFRLLPVSISFQNGLTRSMNEQKEFFLTLVAVSNIYFFLFSFFAILSNIYFFIPSQFNLIQEKLTEGFLNTRDYASSGVYRCDPCPQGIYSPVRQIRKQVL